MDRRELLRLEVPFGLLGGAIIATAVAFALAGIPSWIPPAPMVTLGIASPLSGMTRSFVALASGEIASAFAWHPLGPALFAAALTAPVVALVSWLRGRRLGLSRLLGSRRLWVVGAIVFAVAWARQIAVL